MPTKLRLTPIPPKDLFFLPLRGALLTCFSIFFSSNNFASGDSGKAAATFSSFSVKPFALLFLKSHSCQTVLGARFTNQGSDTFQQKPVCSPSCFENVCKSRLLVSNTKRSLVHKEGGGQVVFGQLTEFYRYVRLPVKYFTSFHIITSHRQILAVRC